MGSINVEAHKHSVELVQEWRNSSANALELRLFALIHRLVKLDRNV